MSKETIQQLIDRHVIDNSGQWNHGTDEAWILAGQGQFKITREEFNAAADRLRGKPDWSEAPDWSGFLAQDPDGRWYWYSAPAFTVTQGWTTGGMVGFSQEGKLIGDWRNTLEKRPEQKGTVDIPAFSLGADDIEPVPAKPWFETGELPQIGVKVEAIIELKYEECEVIAYFEDMAWLSVGGSKRHPVRMIENCKFRPIRTEREKFIEAADLVIHDLQPGSEIRTEFLEALFDAGFKAPDNKKPG